ncbi:Uncharacterized protein FWK35_00034988 [Aphis craccivora]|uniref:CCHC-type domain-containing protein n=1 Tax=Aphis craccivora TaxID=307492 RepID=A0A6G0W0F1_APHCR|nr:Uncharacterized protein FWK35_00034988 [Aphis craccivora]
MPNTATRGDNPSNGESRPKAPTYLELFNAVASLIAQLQQLQSTSTPRQPFPAPTADLCESSSHAYKSRTSRRSITLCQNRAVPIALFVILRHARPLTDWVHSRQHTTRDELLSDIQDWQRMRAKRKEKFESTNSSTTKPRFVKQKTADDPNRTKNEIRRNHRAAQNRPTVYCYNCRGAGHISKDCPRPRRPVKCSNCHSDDRISSQHTRGRCPIALIPRRPPTKHTSRRCDDRDSAVLIRPSIARACGLNVRDTVCPLYTVGNADKPSTMTGMTIGEGDADFIIDDVLAADHPLKVVLDHSLPVDVLVGRTWLNLPHVNYFKQGGEIVFETNSCISADALAETHAEDILYVAGTDSVRPAKEPITADDVVIDADVIEIQPESLMTLLNEHRDVFAKNIMELGCTNVIAMDIAETPGSAS